MKVEIRFVRHNGTRGRRVFRSMDAAVHWFDRNASKMLRVHCVQA